VSPRNFRRLATVALVAFAVIIVTGGAVRLTGSGLGCPDWPSCYEHGLTAQLSFHPMVEFVNRCITVVVTIAAALTFLGSLCRGPRRADLVWLSASLVAGIVGQIVLGGLVVLFHLNPYLVMAHLLFSLAIVVVAVVLVHRARLDDAVVARPGEPVVGRELTVLSRLLMLALAVVIAAGTAVTGAGPHAGDPGAGVKRIPVAFRDVAELHSTLALFLVGMTIATLFALHQAKVPAVVLARARLLLEMMAVQGALGYTQYFLHDNALVVGFHIAGMTVLVVTGTSYYLSLTSHPAQPSTARGARPEERTLAQVS
jgi:cytochrome c oxidase assembly protein subunit 15